MFFYSISIFLDFNKRKYIENQECKVRLQFVNFNSDEPVFYRVIIITSKCSGSCNNINDPYAKMCVPDVIKNINVKMFNIMSRD